MYRLDDEEDSYVPYVPVKQQRLQKLQLLASRGPKAKVMAETAKENEGSDSAVDDEEREEEKKRERTRLDRTLLLEAQQVQANKAMEGMHFYIEK